jgi:hypothetical protein
MVEMDAKKAIQNYRFPTERNDSLATNIGQGARNVVNAAVDVGQWADDQITTDNGRRKQMTDFVDEVVEGYKGADDAAKAGGDANKPAVGDQPDSLNNRIYKQKSKEAEDNPPTEQQTQQADIQVFNTGMIASSSSAKRPTKAQREERAEYLTLMRISGNEATPAQAERFMNTGYFEAGKKSVVTKGLYDYTMQENPDGTVTFSDPVLNKTAYNNMKSQQKSTAEADLKQRVADYKIMASAAVSRAGIVQTKIGDNGKESKFTGVGPFATVDSIGPLSMRFIDNHSHSLTPMLGFDPTTSHLSRGQKRLIEGVMVAYTSALAKSKTGEISFTNANDFSQFLKTYSATSGSYLIGGRLVSLDEQVDIEMQANPNGDSALMRANIQAELTALQN